MGKTTFNWENQAGFLGEVAVELSRGCQRGTWPRSRGGQAWRAEAECPGLPCHRRGPLPQHPLKPEQKQPLQSSRTSGSLVPAQQCGPCLARGRPSVLGNGCTETALMLLAPS